MIAYLDASVVLRLVLGEPGLLAQWTTVERAVASALTEVESLRTLDRMGRRGALSVGDIAERRGAVFRLLEACEVVDVTRAVLRRAAEPFPTPLGTPDAIHLATALAWRDATGDALVLATHDRELATAASAMGLTVVGA
ncbi:MAG: type II toxin-antitoxin system VapC family toxin [Gemmatimonadales bacterium]|nr:type II toxin-antitoxin system VapC family toxin [Gemmatimonadales bacterium]